MIWFCNDLIVNMYLSESNIQDARSKVSKGAEE